MSTRRRDAATATIGLTGVGAAGALRHEGLVRSYGERGPSPLKRPRLLAERRMLKHPKGRVQWLAGAGLGALSVPPAAVGTSRLVNKADQRRKPFLVEGVKGVQDSLHQRSQTLAEKPPPRLMAGNYALGGAIGSAAGGLTHLGLGRTKVPGAVRSGLAATAGVLAGASTLPLQSRAIQRASHGRYEATATGVRRRKTRPVRASARASTVDTRSGSPAANRAAIVGKMSPRTLVNTGAAAAGAHWTVNLVRAADKVAPKTVPASRRGKLVATGRTKAANTVRAVAYDASAINDKDQLVREGLAKADDPGASMSRGERRARVSATGIPVPVVGDVLQARAAGRLSPQHYRRRSAVQNFAASTGGGLAGNVAGAAGALGLAHVSPGFNRKASAANDAVDAAKATVRSKVGLSGAAKPRRAPAQLASAAARWKGSVAGRAVARNPKVAAIGALAGGAVGGMAAQQATYGHIMTRDDAYRHAHNPSARHGTRVAKADQGTALSPRERAKLVRRKHHNAAMSMITGTTGLSALGATLGAHLLKVKNPAVAAKLAGARVPLLTSGAGVSGVNAFNNAAIQRKESQTIKKGLVATGARRAPAMRRGFVRQTRYPSGMIRATSVRGGLT